MLHAASLVRWGAGQCGCCLPPDNTIQIKHHQLMGTISVRRLRTRLSISCLGRGNCNGTMLRPVATRRLANGNLHHHHTCLAEVSVAWVSPGGPSSIEISFMITPFSSLNCSSSAHAQGKRSLQCVLTWQHRQRSDCLSNSVSAAQKCRPASPLPRCLLQISISGYTFPVQKLTRHDMT